MVREKPKVSLGKKAFFVGIGGVFVCLTLFDFFPKTHRRVRQHCPFRGDGFGGLWHCAQHKEQIGETWLYVMVYLYGLCIFLIFSVVLFVVLVVVIVIVVLVNVVVVLVVFLFKYL